MRMMMRFTVPAETSNKAFLDGSMAKTLDEILTKLKPEAAYFAPIDGKRGGMVFFDMAEPSKIIEACEPFFLNWNAHVEFMPVMNGDDLRKGFAAMAEK
jgi:hypothetical protein